MKIYGEYIQEGMNAPPEDLSSWILHAEMKICNTKFWFADDVNLISKGNIVRLTITVATAKEALREMSSRKNIKKELLLKEKMRS